MCVLFIEVTYEYHMGAETWLAHTYHWIKKCNTFNYVEK